MRSRALAWGILVWVGCADNATPSSSLTSGAGAGASGADTAGANSNGDDPGASGGGGAGGAGPMQADAARPSADGGPGVIEADGATEPGPAEFGLQSPVLSDGGEFPEKYSCNGEDISPALRWGSVPEGTESYALVFTDLDAMIPGDSGPFVHWALFNIPKQLTELPENIGDGPMPQAVPGATQVRAWSALGGAVGGSQYLGPCPSEPHSYEFALYALSVPSLEGMDQNRQPTEVKALLEQADFVLKKTTLTGLYTPPP